MSATPPSAPPAALVTCPKCSAQVPCYDPANSEYFSCFHCRTYFKAAPGAPNNTGYILSGFKRELPPGPSLPLGATGILGGHACRLTGYQVRSEKNDRTAEWREYQLRPTEQLASDTPIGFPLQLAEYQGHWLLIKRAPSFPATKGTRLFQEREWTSKSTGNTYKLWHRYEPIIRDAQGEFDWNILNDEQLTIQEFTCPPYLLSSEQPLNERPTWYLAEYLEPEQVAESFSLLVSALPYRAGNGAAQPNPHRPGAAWRLFGIAALLLLGLAAWLTATRPSVETTENFTVPAVPAKTDSLAITSRPIAIDSTAALAAAGAPATTSAAPGYSQMLVSKSFDLTYPAALDLTFTVPGLSNHWLEVTASLVNEQTGRGYEVTRSLEYYEGVEDGERWSEGNYSASATLAGLPPGRYHLNLYPSPEPGTGDVPLELQLKRYPGLEANFCLILLLMSALPLWQWMRHSSFETSRWENSNFGPTTTTDA